jgi:alkanesulfonate monooxygenase SsuD/methylene tetrahydromethanopterin reductase-like flavin-dependent oxidoreductase (luciferase family)
VNFLWFHLMPYMDLPADFREQNSSVWVDINPALFDPARAHEMYNDYFDELEYAAKVGFDAICVNEHHSNAYGLMPSPNLIAMALARATKDVKICVLGNSIALYNPPTRVAEEFAMIDCVSGGRLIAGFPVGTPMDTCFAYSANPSQLRQRYVEAHDLITRAWTEPRPIQKPHPPIWIPGGGSVETWTWCVENEYVYCYLSYGGYKAAQDTMKGFWNVVESHGKEKNPYRAGFLQFVGVAESRQQAMDLYTEPAEYFYGRCQHIDPRYAGPAGYVTEATQRAGLTGQVASVADRSKRRRPTEMTPVMSSLERRMKSSSRSTKSRRRLTWGNSCRCYTSAT